MTHLSLFTGIGGLDLAAEWAGFETVGQCEWADYPTKVLEKHWPDVPRWRDIRTLTGDDFYERTGLHTVTVISGGFPCQPFSFAGKRRGKQDNRFLWPEMLRIISELRPAWVIGENVAGIVNMALDEVCFALENKGYTVQAFIIPACAVDAPHRRDRVFIVAWDADSAVSGPFRSVQEGASAKSAGVCFVSDTESAECKGQRGKTRGRWAELRRSGWWSAEPNVGRVANGISARIHRLKCLGNAVVPQQAYPIFKAIAEIEQFAGRSDA